VGDPVRVFAGCAQLSGRGKWFEQARLGGGLRGVTRRLRGIRVGQVQFSLRDGCAAILSDERRPITRQQGPTQAPGFVVWPLTDTPDDGRLAGSLGALGYRARLGEAGRTSSTRRPERRSSGGLHKTEEANPDPQHPPRLCATWARAAACVGPSSGRASAPNAAAGPPRTPTLRHLARQTCATSRGGPAPTLDGDSASAPNAEAASAWAPSPHRGGRHPSVSPGAGSRQQPGGGSASGPAPTSAARVGGAGLSTEAD
jgi:hypothetical protein